MRRWRIVFVLSIGLALSARAVSAQTLASDDAVLARIWQEGMENSHVYRLGQALLDSIGPRLTGTPGYEAAAEWVLQRYRAWDIEARNEQYGTWLGWRRGITHVDLVEPRVRTLEGIMLAWSPGTNGTVRGGVAVFPDLPDSAAFAAWLPSVRGKFVLLSFGEPMCRPEADVEEFATEESLERLKAARDTARRAWNERLRRSGVPFSELPRRLEDAGALGVLTSNWPGGWGVTRVFSARTERVPTLGLSCEDYGLVFRLATHGQAPVLEVEADAEFLGEVPAFNTIAEIRGTERPDEFVVLSAHFDSWDGASGATDNGTGTLTVLEAMRLLKTAYPRPKRTIIAGHWGSEEQGLNGSRAFAQDHPEVVEGLQALFNQDNGTGRITRISMQGLTRAGEHFARWLTQVPEEIAQHISLTMPGIPGGGGSDYAAFLCAGAPSFFLFALDWSYFGYTWHTNRDTFDKVVIDDLKNNATLFAMLAYLAAEDPERVPRDRRVLPVNPRTGEQRTWPTCRDGRRSWEAFRR